MADHAAPDHGHAPADHEADLHPAPQHGKGGSGLDRVKAVMSQGWEAVEEVAAISKDYASEWPHIAEWLHKNRGNDFVKHVTAEMSGTRYKATKFPIVMVHGFSAAPGDNLSFNEQIPSSLRGDGDAVFEVTSPPFASSEERARAIAPQLEKILKETGAQKLNLVAHSQGGLDARYLISSLGWADRIASLSMVGTPNRGTGSAEVASKLPAGADGALNSLGRELNSHVVHSPMTDQVDGRGTINSMTEHGAAKFNAENPDKEGVYYQSWAGVSTMTGHLTDADLAKMGPRAEPAKGDPHQAGFMNPMLYIASMLTHSKANGALNDGAVPEESAKWGDYHGALMADHWGEIGQQTPGDQQRTGFDPVEFYRKMANDLARKGY